MSNSELVLRLIWGEGKVVVVTMDGVSERGVIVERKEKVRGSMKVSAIYRVKMFSGALKWVPESALGEVEEERVKIGLGWPRLCLFSVFRDLLLKERSVLDKNKIVFNCLGLNRDSNMYLDGVGMCMSLDSNSSSSSNSSSNMSNKRESCENNDNLKDNPSRDNPRDNLSSNGMGEDEVVVRAVYASGNSVGKILGLFEVALMELRPQGVEEVKEGVKGLMELFLFAVHTLILYREERMVYEKELYPDSDKILKYYGLTHLLRMLLVLPQLQGKIVGEAEHFEHAGEYLKALNDYLESNYTLFVPESMWPGSKSTVASNSNN
ncbi:hypothetical protein NEHOM01_1707 [Nematocida homosporus]|uniref:uncharacterized protein n=1 Tax=Nematocida homosporus TaxID=1912981 RepID=UPI002220F10A|nr:uncharacterized protein NEHOM01_1707 [Nematocida homosporus]KAI5186787.1 hypothetical protein NEHOM01_1707 [Nematocida homosporus]